MMMMMMIMIAKLISRPRFRPLERIKMFLQLHFGFTLAPENRVQLRICPATATSCRLSARLVRATSAAATRSD